MKDPRIAAMMAGKKNPFDVKRMGYGGFRVLVEAFAARARAGRRGSSASRASKTRRTR
jgi:hypothetical protein